MVSISDEYKYKGLVKIIQETYLNHIRNLNAGFTIHQKFQFSAPVQPVSVSIEWDIIKVLSWRFCEINAL